VKFEELPDMVGEADEILRIHIFKTRVRDEAEADTIAKSEIGARSSVVRTKKSKRT